MYAREVGDGRWKEGGKKGGGHRDGGEGADVDDDDDDEEDGEATRIIESMSWPT